MNEPFKKLYNANKSICNENILGFSSIICVFGCKSFEIIEYDMGRSVDTGCPR